MSSKKNPTEIVEFETSKIIPYEQNNKVHSDEQINHLANSIAEFGFNQPIVIDEHNIVLAGHGRLLAARKLGLPHVPVIIVSNLTETQKKAYRIVDNKIAADAPWDFANLELEFAFLGENGFDLENWGLDKIGVSISELKNDHENIDYSEETSLGLFVECKTESQQKELRERLISEGFECKIIG